MDPGFVADPPRQPPPVGGERLVVDLDGWEGPLDLLLDLARDQKVDLARLSILRLADQYLEFIARVRRTHLDLAAEYLVMAAWLAYLKSRLLLPEPTPDPADEPTPAEMAEALAFRLRRLQAMRDAGARLFAGPRLGQTTFGRGAPEGIERVDRPLYSLRLYDLLRAYADHLARRSVTVLTVEAADLWSVEDALARLESLLGLGRLPDWSVLMAYLPAVEGDPLRIRSAMASTFVAALELARQGRLVLRQDGGPAAPILVRAARPDEVDDGADDDEARA